MRCTLFAAAMVVSTGALAPPVMPWPALRGQEKDEPLVLKHKGFVYGVAFSPDGKTLAAGSYAVVKLWEPATWKELAVLEGHTQPVDTVAFSPDGKTLAS